MVKFLNGFSQSCRGMAPEEIRYLESLFRSFLAASVPLGPKPFHGKTGQFNVLLFEVAFAAVATAPYKARELIEHPISRVALEALQTDAEFVRATQSQTAQKANVALRLGKARAKLTS